MPRSSRSRAPAPQILLPNYPSKPYAALLHYPRGPPPQLHERFAKPPTQPQFLQFIALTRSCDLASSWISLWNHRQWAKEVRVLEERTTFRGKELAITKAIWAAGGPLVWLPLEHPQGSEHASVASVVDLPPSAIRVLAVLTKKKDQLFVWSPGSCWRSCATA